MIHFAGKLFFITFHVTFYITFYTRLIRELSFIASKDQTKVEGYSSI
jgi:hypothetical protein